MFVMNKDCKEREPTDKDMITATLGDDNLYHVDDMTKFITSTQANYICRCDGKSILNRMVIPTTQTDSIEGGHMYVSPIEQQFLKEETLAKHKARELSKLKENIKNQIKEDKATYEIQKSKRKGSSQATRLLLD